MSTFGNVGLRAPEMDDVIVCNLDVLCVISPEHNGPVLRKCLFHFVPPVHLQLPIIFDTLGGHESLNSWSQIPAGAKDLIASKMDVRCISEQVINLLVDLLGQLVDGGF